VEPEYESVPLLGPVPVATPIHEQILAKEVNI